MTSMMHATFATFSLLMADPVAVAPPQVQQIEQLKTEVDAVGYAFSALTSYPPESQPFIRFVWIPPWADAEWIGVVDFAVNVACNHTTKLIRGDQHAGGWLLAYNLRHLAPDPATLVKLIETWDSLAPRESKFHVSQVNFVEVVETVTVKQRDQRTGQLRDVPTKQTRRVQQEISVLAPHLQEALARNVKDPSDPQRVDVLIAHLTASTGGIYPADFLIEQLLTSARGKYPEFRQIDFAAKDGHSPLVNLQSKYGFYLQSSQDILGDKGALILNSDVTGKSRVILTVYGLASRLPMAQTFDFKDNRIRPDQQFVRNLIRFQPLADAHESFIPLPCGLILYVLSDGQGNIQRTAPPDVVADHTKPDGFTHELEMGMSCIVCHSNENGYKTARNDMNFLLNSDSDYFGDEITHNGKLLSRQEAVAIVAGRYGEQIDDPDGILGRARRDYIKAIDVLTDYEVTADGPTSVQRLGLKIKEIYHGYRYSRIDAQRLCLELGFRVPESLALATLRKLVPPRAAGETEDVLLPLIRNGAQIKRDDLDAVYPELARRAIETRDTVVTNTKE